MSLDDELVLDIMLAMYCALPDGGITKRRHTWGEEYKQWGMEKWAWGYIPWWPKRKTFILCQNCGYRARRLR